MMVIIYIIMVDYSIKMLWNSTYKVLLRNLPMIFINNSTLLRYLFCCILFSRFFFQDCDGFIKREAESFSPISETFSL